MFKKLKLVFIAILLLLIPCTINAENEEYEVVDAKSKQLKTFDNYNDALDYYEDNLDNFDNLVFKDENKVIDMEYGIVRFKGKENQYFSISKNCVDYISGHFGRDGAYLYTKDNNVYFVINGDYGYIDKDNIELIAFDELDVNVSLYHTDEDYLYHFIKTDLDVEYINEVLKLDFIPEGLNKDSNYYSYDGHYFYDDFYLMIDDYRNNNHENSVSIDAYYNYYQYLPYRSLSNYSLAEIENYFYDYLGMDGRVDKYYDVNIDGAADKINRSQLYGNIASFVNYQYIFGCNSLLNISSAIEESKYGRNLNSFINNNLYLNSAYDSELERENERYTSIDKSIYTHSKYFISNKFSNHNRSDYYGTYLGDKIGGINVEYTIDQYYGEKCASVYFNIDEKLGLKDYKANCIGIILNNDDVDVYYDSGLNEVRFGLGEVSQLSFVILDEFEDSYLVQIDDSNSSQYYYDFDDSIGYIEKDDFTYIFNEDKINSKEFVSVHYDFDGGKYCDSYKLDVKSDSKDNLDIRPIKEGYEFIGYVDDVAQYKKIDSIDIKYLMEINKECYPYYDFSNSELLVKYEDGSNKIIPINSDMVNYYDGSDVGEVELVVNYCGVETSKTIYLDGEYYGIYNELQYAIENDDIDGVALGLNNVDYYLDMSKIKNYDLKLREYKKRNYVINDETGKYDVSISGLDMALEDRDDFVYVNDTYYVNIKNVDVKSASKICKVGYGYDFKDVRGINLSFKFNYQDIDLNTPIVVEAQIENKLDEQIYSVYYLDNNGDVIKCYTEYSDNYVRFIARGAGDYIIFKKKGFNKISVDDSMENLSYANMGIDNHRINIELLSIIAMLMIGFIGITIFYIMNGRKKRQWKDYKKSLQRVDTVQEEKLKN